MNAANAVALAIAIAIALVGYLLGPLPPREILMSATAAGILQLVFLVALLALAYRPLGDYMARVFTGSKHLVSSVSSPSGSWARRSPTTSRPGWSSRFSASATHRRARESGAGLAGRA